MLGCATPGSLISGGGCVSPVTIAAGDEVSCASGPSFTQCWGSNQSGLVGDGTSSNRTRPTAVAGLSGALQIATARNHSCAVTASHGAMCWGENEEGELGNGTDDDSSRPVAVQSLGANVAAVTVGFRHSCALMADGRVRCWGRNNQRQLGREGDGSEVPVEVSGLTGVTAISAGSEHTCALTAAGQVWCWGSNNDGQLGTLGGSRRATPARSRRARP